jgi:hypothetical protein
MKEPIKRTSERFRELSERYKGKSIPVGEFADSFGGTGHSVFILFLCVPFVTPIPVPGLSTLFGLLIAIAGIRISFGFPPWVPERFRSKEISEKMANHIFTKGIATMKKVEVLTKPRIAFFSVNPWVRYFNGFVIVAMALVLALPLPPGTNFPPALAIVLMALGHLEEDGIIILLGYVVFGLNVAAITLISIFGMEGFKQLFT